MTQPDAPGDHLVQKLIWVHGIIRNDLAIVRSLVQDVLAGKQPEHIRSAIARLETRSPLWQLTVNCIYYCRLVHAHYHGEDAYLFPALRRSGPAMEPVVDRLETDHRKVSEILDEVDLAVRALEENGEPCTPQARSVRGL